MQPSLFAFPRALAPEGTLSEISVEAPEWNLADLYDGPDCPRLAQDLEEARAAVKTFAEHFEGRLASLEAADLGEAIAAYERLDETLSRAMSYAGLLYAAAMTDPAIASFYQRMHEQVTTISSGLVFFCLEINQLEDAALEVALQAPGVARYRAWLRDVRTFRPHQLSPEAERLLHEKGPVGRSAWVRLFDESLADLRFPVGGRALSSAQALHLLSEPDAGLRQEAALSLGQVLGERQKLFAHIYNALIKDQEIEDGWRRYATPWSSRNLGNHVEDAVVDALLATVKAAYPDLSHRYYALKARWMGVETLEYWDRNAPLPGTAEPPIAWEEARDLTLDAYGRFSPEMRSVGALFFEHGWIDAKARPDKNPGAFAHPVVPSAHPYLLMNYMGRTRDVMTLAHELGHGVHQYLCRAQGHLQAATPLTLAETASVFGEMLTFRSLLSQARDPAQRKRLLAGKVEDMMNTSIRQIAFYHFERRAHRLRREGELSAEQLSDLWMEVQGESLGPAFRFHESYRAYWTYIGHFFHAPFYVYAYAFGDCLVNSLYALYEEAAAKGEAEAFAARYLTMLRSAGTLRHQELLAPFGLDLSDPHFWAKGLDLLKRYIDELEAM
jgi:oligoendopeptidase F